MCCIPYHSSINSQVCITGTFLYGYTYYETPFMYLNQAISMFNADMAKGSNIYMTESSPNNMPDLWGLAFIDCHIHSKQPRN